MDQTEKDVVVAPPSALPVTTVDLARQIVDEVFAVEPLQSLAQIEAISNNLLPQLAPSPRLEIQPLLEALWGFFKALELMREGDFTNTADQFQESAKTFDRLTFYDLRDLSVGMGVYVTAVVMLRQMNVGQAMEYFAKVKTYLEIAGKFRSRFQSMIDHMEPDALLASGLQALMTLDFANAKILLDKAAVTSEKVAQKYYAQDVTMTNTFNGLAQYYRAFYTMVQALNNLNQFALDKFEEGDDLTKTAKSACDLLSRGDKDNQNITQVLMMARGFEPMLEAIRELAELMKKVFGATFKADLKVLNHIRANFEKGKDYFAQAGLQAAPLLRFCDQLLMQVNNLERLARPSKKDFGVFSGLISCALFLPIFLVASWGKSRFGIDLEGASLMWTCVGLSLIGGFGFGALKFKSFFSQGSGDKPEKASDDAS